jgi:tripeptide aminopeptidase
MSTRNLATPRRRAQKSDRAPLPTNGAWKLDASAAVKLVMTLMAIPGRSGCEREVLTFIRSRLREAKLPASALAEDSAHKRSSLGGQAGNLVVKLPGTVRGPRRLLMAHVDTVPLCVGSQPVRKGDLIVSRNRNSGLGADDRAGTAALLDTLLWILREKPPHPPLTFFWPVQEEVGLLGARHVDLKKLGGPKLCFNWDGGAPDVAVVGATGGSELRIEVRGLASHAGVHPEQGISAIAIAGIAIAELAKNGWHGLVVKGPSKGTSNIGIITAGEATNVVTPHLTLRAEARSHDPRFRQAIIDAFRAAFESAVQAVKNDAGATGQVDFEAELKYESFRIPADNPAVQSAMRAIEKVGLIPSTRVSDGGLDANWMTARGLPTVTLGCGQQSIHTVNETLHVESYLNACRIARLLATGAV